jgi:hypothetical protein
MSILDKVVGGILKPVASIIDEFHTSGEEKAAAKLKLVEIQANIAVEMEKAIQAETDAKEAIIVAEMQQGDLYTKRARPTIVYAGLGIAFLNHVILPWTAYFIGKSLPSIDMPSEFWISWASVVGIWSIGRSAERRGMQNKMLSVITGNEK